MDGTSRMNREIHVRFCEGRGVQSPRLLGKLLRYDRDNVMAFERFDEHYYQPKYGLPEDRRVRFKNMDLRLIPEEATRIAAIRTGEGDVAPVSLAARKQVEAGGGRITFGPEGVLLDPSLMGCWRPEFPCRDKRVRQALAYAIDKKVMRDNLFGAEVFQQKGWWVVTPSTLGYSQDLDPFPFDPTKAKQLLAEAGYPEGKGFGKLVIHSWVSTSLQFLPESAQLAADSWKKNLGIEVEVMLGDETALKRRALTDELHGQILWADNQTRADAESLVTSWYGTPGHTQRRHESAELFSLVEKTLAVSDNAERSRAFNSLFRTLREEQYNLGVGYLNIPWAVGPRVQAWQPAPLAFYPANLHGLTLR